MDPLSSRLIENAVVYPTIRVASHPGKLLMGVYDPDGYVEGTVLYRRSGEQGAPAPRDLFAEPVDAVQPEAIYLGPLYFHYGHFLLESLARAWYARAHPGVPLVWAGQYNWQRQELQPWQRDILEALGLTVPTIIADPTRFERLHVPDIGYRYDDWLHPEHAEFLACYQGPAQVPGHRLWLSRSKVGSNVRDYNSAPAERRLVRAGWTVVHPESLSIRQQLDHLARAEVVAGEEGSAFHTLVLLQDITAKKFLMLRRHGREHGSMHSIGDVRHVNQSFHTLKRERVLQARGRVVYKINPNASEILDVLGVPVPAAREVAPAAGDDAILQQVVRRAEPQSFLDVGALTPHLVVGSTAPTRVAVSPRFEFDPRTFAASGVDFYELGITRYAHLFHADRGQFDLIRIAGADFEQVMAAFRISKRLAHDGTTWIFGSGELAARAALAVRLSHPGFISRRLVAEATMVYIVQRVPGEAMTEKRVATMSAVEVQRRSRWIPPVRVSSLAARRPGSAD